MAIRNWEKIQQALTNDANENVKKEQLRVAHMQSLIDKLIARNQDITDAIDTYYACNKLNKQITFGKVVIKQQGDYKVFYTSTYDYRDVKYSVYYAPRKKEITCCCSERLPYWWHWNEKPRNAHDERVFIDLIETIISNIDIVCNQVFDFVESL